MCVFVFIYICMWACNVCVEFLWKLPCCCQFRPWYEQQTLILHVSKQQPFARISDFLFVGLLQEWRVDGGHYWIKIMFGCIMATLWNAFEPRVHRVVWCCRPGLVLFVCFQTYRKGLPIYWHWVIGFVPDHRAGVWSSDFREWELSGDEAFVEVVREVRMRSPSMAALWEWLLPAMLALSC